MSRDCYSRRTFLKAMGLGTITFPMATDSSSSAALASKGERPNIIVIFADDLGYGDLGCFGSKTIRTPSIDRMAEEGMKLTSFYVTCGVCSPSRASLMTGCYYKRVSINKVLFPAEAIGLNPDETTMAELLNTRGYVTACVGKWHLGDQPAFLPTRHGFDEYFGLPYSNDMHVPNKARRYNPLPLMIGEKVVETEPDQDYLTKRYTDYAIKFIKQNRSRPFFLYLPHSMPHRPCYASPPFMKRFNKEQLAQIGQTYKQSRDFIYPATVEEIDWSVGQIVKTLKELGIDKRTLVVFTSDNGPAIGSAGPLRGGKGSTWEGGMRVPCVARWPGKIPAGSVCNEVASTIDLLPTFVRLAGAGLQGGRIDGKDIWSLLSHQPGAKSPHEAFFYYRGPNLCAVRAGAWKLHIAGRGIKKPQLYNLETDIAEKTDVAADNPHVVKRLTAFIEEARHDMGDGQKPGRNVRPSGRVENPKPLTKIK